MLSVVWFAFYRDPMTDKRVSEAELAYIKAGGALVDLEAKTQDGQTPKQSLKGMSQLFTSRTLWAIYLGQYCITSLSYFFITWFPIYLIKGRGMSIMEAGWVAALPAICGFAGGLLGGLLSDALIKRGVHASRARKTPFIIGMGLSSALVLANYTDSNVIVIALMVLAFFGKGLGAVGWAVVSDIAPKDMVGLTGGVFNGIGNLAGIVTPLVIGYVLAVTGSFDLVLWFVAAHGIIGMLSYLLLAGRFERIEIQAH